MQLLTIAGARANSIWLVGFRGWASAHFVPRIDRRGSPQKAPPSLGNWIDHRPIAAESTIRVEKLAGTIKERGKEFHSRGAGN